MGVDRGADHRHRRHLGDRAAAQLDIGFVRAQTEIGMLELQPDYARGHLSRYTALYTSLSTTYDFEFDESDGARRAFPDQTEFRMLSGQGITRRELTSAYDEVRLTGVPVSSNSTNMVHSEQMLALDGAIRLGSRKSPTGSADREPIEARSLQACASWQARTATRRRAKRRTSRHLDRRVCARAIAAHSRVAVDRERPVLRRQATRPKGACIENAAAQPGADVPVWHSTRRTSRPGEMRLVARIDEVLPGETITPAASQVRGATLVVAHLTYAPRPEPQQDANTSRDIKANDELPEFEHP